MNRREKRNRKRNHAWICFALVFALLFPVMAGSAFAAEEEHSYSTYQVGKKTITVMTGEKKMVYRRYAEQKNTGYLQRQGCVHTAVSIIASAFGKNYAPAKIHGAKASKKYGEKYAVKRLKTVGKNTYLAGRGAITVTLAGQILKDMGIPAVVKYKVPYKKTCRLIRRHLQKGLPVLVKAGAVNYKGTCFTTAHHALVLAGIDREDHIILIDTWTAAVNSAAITCNTVRLSLEEFVKNFMFAGSESAKQPYVGTMSAAGGYILVG